ncbi:uncharacterized protein V1516DRAFT_669987 [Lipomyces oligophaga]|uniref:uncharacterized protein n=1 Tax=Lipomyces oligophaga TaxID=45792 RepID=UPI0034CF32C8
MTRTMNGHRSFSPGHSLDQTSTDPHVSAECSNVNADESHHSHSDQNTEFESESASHSTKPVRKRRRIPVVCAVCRQRKLKCDRNQPCSACVAHDTVFLCKYAVKPWTRDSTLVSDSPSKPPSLQPIIPRPLQSLGAQTKNLASINPPTSISPKYTLSFPKEINSTLVQQQQQQQQQQQDPPEYGDLQSRLSRVESLLERLAQVGLTVNIEGLKNSQSLATAPISLSSGASSILSQASGEQPNSMPLAQSSAPTMSLIPLNQIPSAQPGIPQTSIISSLEPQTVSSTVQHAPPVPLSAMDMRVLHPEMSIRKNRVTYFGPLSSVVALREDEFVKQFLDRVDREKKIIVRKGLESRILSNGFGLGNAVGPEKGHSSHDTSLPRNISYIPERMKAYVEDTFDVKANPVRLFPRLEHRPICEYFIDRFLESINLIFPVVNPNVFRADMEKYWKAKELAIQQGAIRDKNGTPERPFWTSTRKNDMRGAALFAVMLRLGRLSLPPDWKLSSAGFDDSLSVLFGPRLQGFVWACLRETNYMGKPNFIVAQVLICIRIHQIIAPEDGDGGDGSDASGFVGMLCQVGISMGLHRDPSVISNTTTDVADLWRLLWAEMVILDTHRTQDLTLPFIIPLEFSDTSLESVRGFAPTVRVSEQFALPFLQTHIKWALLARSILGRLIKPGYVLSLDQFKSSLKEMNQFEEQHLSSFQSLISILRTDATMSGSQDSYNLVQKFTIQILFLRLQLSLLRSYAPPDFDAAEDLRRDRLRCALKMLDTLSTCMRYRRLFNGFEWFLIPFSLRNFSFPLSLIVNATLKAYYADPSKVIIPPVPTGSDGRCDDSKDTRWLYPDLTFQYDDWHVCDLQRLYQAFVQTHLWIKEFTATYYGAFKPQSTVHVLAEFLRHEIVGSAERRKQTRTSQSQPLTSVPKGAQHITGSSITTPQEPGLYVPSIYEQEETPFSISAAGYQHLSAYNPLVVDEQLIFGNDLASSLAMMEANESMNGTMFGWTLGRFDPEASVPDNGFSFTGFGAANEYI